MKIAVFGEGMVELSRDGATPDLWRVGYGGDTLNTAIHLARLGFDVLYLTALGTDRFSDKLRSDWQAEGVITDHVLTDPERAPGLYAIDTDEQGERSFSYWRGESAVRRFFQLAGADAALGAAAEADLFYFSLISLAVLSKDDRGRLLDFCRSVRSRGRQVAVDSNYRPRLWSSVDEARNAAAAGAAIAGIGLPTLTDEQMLFGRATAAEVAARWHEAGCPEVAVKLGADGCLISTIDGESIAVPSVPVTAPKDTSGAGDAFNAAYLGARLRGASPDQAAREGHRLASWVIGLSGAIPAADAQAPYATSYARS